MSSPSANLNVVTVTEYGYNSYYGCLRNPMPKNPVTVEKAVSIAAGVIGDYFGHLSIEVREGFCFEDIKDVKNDGGTFVYKVPSDTQFIEKLLNVLRKNQREFVETIEFRRHGILDKRLRYFDHLWEPTPDVNEDDRQIFSKDDLDKVSEEDKVQPYRVAVLHHHFRAGRALQHGRSQLYDYNEIFRNAYIMNYNRYPIDNLAPQNVIVSKVS